MVRRGRLRRAQIFVQLVLCASTCAANSQKRGCSDAMGFETLLQRGGELEGSDRAAAAECLGLAARLEPRNVLAWVRLAELQQRSGKVHEALQTIEEVMRADAFAILCTVCVCARHTPNIVRFDLPSHVPARTRVCAYSALYLSLDLQKHEQGLKELPSLDTGGTVQLITPQLHDLVCARVCVRVQARVRMGGRASKLMRHSPRSQSQHRWSNLPPFAARFSRTPRRYNLGYHYMTQYEYKASRDAFKRSGSCSCARARARARTHTPRRIRCMPPVDLRMCTRTRASVRAQSLTGKTSVAVRLSPAPHPATNVRVSAPHDRPDADSSVDLNPSFGRAAEAVGAVYFGDGQEESSIPWFERAVGVNAARLRVSLFRAAHMIHLARWFMRTPSCAGTL